MTSKSPVPTTKTSRVHPPNGRRRAGPRPAGLDSHTDRKRELDRIAQRKSRERCKNRILILEEKIRSFEVFDNGGQTAQHLATIESLRTNNTALRSALMKISFIVDDALQGSSNVGPGRVHSDNKPPASDSPTGEPSELVVVDPFQQEFDPSEQPHEDPPGPNQVTDTTTTQPAPETSTALVTGGHPAGRAKPVYEQLFACLPEYDIQWLAGLGDLGHFDTAFTAQSPSRFDRDLMSPSNRLEVVSDAEKWHVSNQAFVSGLTLSRTAASLDLGLDSDTPVRAIRWGWEAVDPTLLNHPTWQALRQIDERVFGDWTSKAQRLAMMYVCHSMMEYRVRPSRENLERVPVWLRPRPSQERFEHPLVIDFLIWPGLRDHLIFTHRKYTQTGKFSRRFCEDLRFHWPFGDDEMFAVHHTTGTYSFSELFRKYANDINNWTMDAKFFETYPELTGSIPASNQHTAPQQ